MPHDTTVSCERVRSELSHFLDGDINTPLREAIELHLGLCRYCAALYDSTRNLLALLRDERVFKLPAGYHERLHAFLTDRMRQSAGHGYQCS